MIPPQIPRVVEILKQVPDLSVALCHCGSPWDQSETGLTHWREGLQQLAQLPRVHCKVSGLGMFNPSWRAQDLRPIVLQVIDIFGPERVMFGSNFPVDKLYNSYDALWDAYDQILIDFSANERRQMLVNTAAGFYRIEL